MQGLYQGYVILSPNPAVNELRLTGMSLDHATIKVYNISGSLVPFERLNENTLDISLFNPGLYFIRIEKEGQVVVKRFVKE